MIEICPKDNCTGCAACIKACHKNAIIMEVDMNRLGHLYPTINNDLCVNCGACQKICPQINKVELYKPHQAFAMWATDKNIHTNSTSGGLAYTIAYAFIKKWNGLVYACAAEYGNKLQIKHIRIENIKELPQIQGSKYVQSTIEDDLYKKIIDDLKQNRKVLFIGTPCQTAAAKKIAKHYIKNFFSIDIICHGVPSLKQLQDYFETIQAQNIKAIHFRTTAKATSPYFLSIKLDEGHWIQKSIGESSYFSAFLRSLNYRESCYKCIYAQPNRPGDITLGDFWGLGKLKNDSKNRHLGVSVFLKNTEKGELLRQIIDEMVFSEERDVDEAIKGNRQLQTPSHRNPLHNIFTYLYPRIGYKWSARICTIKDRFHYLYLVPVVSKIQTIIRK